MSKNTKQIGFLFDVDGTLTSFQGNDSKIDLLIFNDLNFLRKQNYPIALVTGRSVEWVQKFFFKNISDKLKNYIAIFGEYGLESWYQSKKETAEISSLTKQKLAEAKHELTQLICKEKDLSTKISYNEPKKRCLWIEPKKSIITFRSIETLGLTVEKFMDIIMEAFNKKYTDFLQIKTSPKALDIIPLQAGKKIGALNAINFLDPQGKIAKWYAFGDSDADKEMEEIENKNITFIKIQSGNVHQTHMNIEKITSSKIF